MNVRQLIEKSTDTWNDRDRDAYRAVYDTDCEITSPGFAGKGQQGVAEFWAGYMDAFPDNRIVLVRAVGEGDVGAEESIFEGTHTGVLVGPDGSEIPPTGKRVSAGFAGIHVLRNGKIMSSHFYYDQVDFLSQLGLMPE